MAPSGKNRSDHPIWILGIRGMIIRKIGTDQKLADLLSQIAGLVGVHLVFLVGPMVTRVPGMLIGTACPGGDGPTLIGQVHINLRTLARPRTNHGPAVPATIGDLRLGVLFVVAANKRLPVAVGAAITPIEMLAVGLRGPGIVLREERIRKYSEMAIAGLRLTLEGQLRLKSGSSLAYTRDSPGLNPSENPPCLEPESPGFALPANRVLEHAKASHPRGSEGVSGHTSFSDHPGPCNPEGQMVDSARRIREPCGVLPVSRSEIDTPALEPSDFLQKRELKDDGTVPMFGEDGDLHICNRETPNNARSPKGPQEAADEKDEPSGSCTSSPIAVQEPYQRRANHVYLWEKVYGEERQKEIRECARLLGDKPLFGPKIKPCRSAPRDDKSGSPSQKVNPGGDLGQHKKRRSKNKTNEEHDNDPTSQTGIKEHQNGHPQSKSQQKNPPVRDTLGTGGILNASTQGVEPTRKLVLTSGESLGPELARAGATI
ncbi:hypothetical protein C7212DRAFT_364752 [Tuber magnatum]|uniref:Uncharacterized protein n=1 Tax=Tuber magnatum TaxID=42249 RepID=A0A317SPB4_9PEZI|nr:hypothetical protein C7212DRAFT_364752 [Tuber magnatum]